MRTREQTIKLLIDRITSITGHAPDPDLVSINEHEGGMTTGLIDLESPAKLIGINLAPASYSTRLSDDGITFLVAHEYATGISFTGISPIEAEMSKAIEACRSKKKQDLVRADFEIERGVIAVQLARKLHIDKLSLEILTSHGYSLKGCLEVFYEEIIEWGKVQPLDRAEARQGFQRIRFVHAKHLIHGQTGIAQIYRDAQDEAVRLLFKTPSVV